LLFFLQSANHMLSQPNIRGQTVPIHPSHSASTIEPLYSPEVENDRFLFNWNPSNCQAEEEVFHLQPCWSSYSTFTNLAGLAMLVKLAYIPRVPYHMFDGKFEGIRLKKQKSCSIETNCLFWPVQTPDSKSTARRPNILWNMFPFESW